MPALAAMVVTCLSIHLHLLVFFKGNLHISWFLMFVSLMSSHNVLCLVDDSSSSLNSFMQVRHDESEQALSHEVAPDNKRSSSGAPSSLQQLASIARPSWAALLEATANDVEVF